MKQIRIRIILLVGWLIVVFGIVLLLEPLGMAPHIYLLVCALTALLLILPVSKRFPLWVPVGIASFSLILLKVFFGEFTSTFNQTLNFIEITVTVISISVTYWVTQALFEFEDAVLEITIGQNNKLKGTVEAGQGSLYREVRRARNHQRPLTILAIGVDESSIHPAVNKILQEAQSSLMKQVVLSGISNILCEELEDCDVVVHDHNQFLVALPEIKPEDLPFVTQRLQKEVTDRIGVKLHIGAASLPQDSFTLEGLIDQATNNINRIDDEDTVFKFNHFRVKQTPSEPQLVIRK